MRTSWRTSSLVTEARRLIFRFISGAENPGRSFSTRNPQMTSSSSLAHTTETSAMVPLVIHILAPFSTQSFPSRRARVTMPPGLDP